MSVGFYDIAVIGRPDESHFILLDHTTCALSPQTSTPGQTTDTPTSETTTHLRQRYQAKQQVPLALRRPLNARPQVLPLGHPHQARMQVFQPLKQPLQGRLQMHLYLGQPHQCKIQVFTTFIRPRSVDTPVLVRSPNLSNVGRG